MIDNLEISADAKVLIKSIMDAVIKVGDVVLRIGKTHHRNRIRTS